MELAVNGFMEMTSDEMMLVDGGDKVDYDWGYNLGRDLHNAWNSWCSFWRNWCYNL